MGEVLSPPLNEPGPRRILAFATALLANSLLFALIFAVPRQDFAAPERAPFELTLLSEPVPSEPVPAEETAEQDNPVDPDTSVEPDTPVDSQTGPVPREIIEAGAPVIAALPADVDLSDEDEDAAASRSAPVFRRSQIVHSPCRPGPARPRCLSAMYFAPPPRTPIARPAPVRTGLMKTRSSLPVLRPKKSLRVFAPRWGWTLHQPRSAPCSTSSQRAIWPVRQR